MTPHVLHFWVFLRLHIICANPSADATQRRRRLRPHGRRKTRCTPLFLDPALSLSHTIQTGQLATVQRFPLAAPRLHHGQNPAHSRSSEEADRSGHISTNLRENPNFHHTKTNAKCDLSPLEDTFPFIYQR